MVYPGSPDVKKTLACRHAALNVSPYFTPSLKRYLGIFIYYVTPRRFKFDVLNIG